MCQARPEKRLRCIGLALKPHVQHKITSNRLRPYCIGYFFIRLQFRNFKVNMERSSCRESKKILTQLYSIQCAMQPWCNCETTKHCPEVKTLPQKNQTFPWYCNQTSPCVFSISDPNIQGLQCRTWSPWLQSRGWKDDVFWQAGCEFRFCVHQMDLILVPQATSRLSQMIWYWHPI